MKNDKTSSIIIYPQALILVSALFLFSFLDIIFNQHGNSFDLLIAYAMFFISAYAIALCFYARIIIKEDMIFLPKTNFMGVPSFLMFRKYKINISAVKKINIFSSNLQSWRVADISPSKFYNVRAKGIGSFGDEKIIVVTEGTGGIVFLLIFFGEQQLERLITELESRNKQIKIVNLRN